MMLGSPERWHLHPRSDEFRYPVFVRPAARIYESDEPFAEWRAFIADEIDMVVDRFADWFDARVKAVRMGARSVLDYKPARRVYRAARPILRGFLDVLWGDADDGDYVKGIIFTFAVVAFVLAWLGLTWAW